MITVFVSLRQRLYDLQSKLTAVKQEHGRVNHTYQVLVKGVNNKNKPQPTLSLGNTM
jgi:hypothetical protein